MFAIQNFFNIYTALKRRISSDRFDNFLSVNYFHASLWKSYGECTGFPHSVNSDLAQFKVCRGHHRFDDFFDPGGSRTGNCNHSGSYNWNTKQSPLPFSPIIVLSIYTFYLKGIPKLGKILQVAWWYFEIKTYTLCFPPRGPVLTDSKNVKKTRLFPVICFFLFDYSYCLYHTMFKGCIAP